MSSCTCTSVSPSDETSFGVLPRYDVRANVFCSYSVMGSAIYVCNGGVTAFGARIVSSFGYSSLQTILLLIPGGFATVVTIFLFTWLNKYKNVNTLLIPISCIPIVVGSLVIWLAPWKHRGVPLFGYYLIPCFGAP